MISSQWFSCLIFCFSSLNFKHGEWTVVVSFITELSAYWSAEISFSEIWILIIRFCYGSTDCHFNATYWSCRQPASHKSCKVPENMIYELSYGKWGPLIFLTLQDAVAYPSLLSYPTEGKSECLIPKCPTTTDLPPTHLPQSMSSCIKPVTSLGMFDSDASSTWGY